MFDFVCVSVCVSVYVFGFCLRKIYGGALCGRYKERSPRVALSAANVATNSDFVQYLTRFFITSNRFFQYVKITSI